MLKRLARPLRPLALAAVGLVVVSQLWSFATHRLADRIGDTARRGTVPAEAASQALRALDDAAIEPLMRLAIDASPDAAEPARAALAARVDEWRRESYRDGARFADRVERLLRALEDRSEPLTTSGQRWAKRFAMDLVSHVSQAPPERRVGLLAAIDATVGRVLSAPTVPDPPPPAPSPFGSVALTAEAPAPAEPLPPPPVARPTPLAVSLPAPRVPDSIESPPAQDWRPDWEKPAEPKPFEPAPHRPIPPAPKPLVAESTPVLESPASDRELLADLLAAAEERGGAPAASGPLSARRRPAPLDAETEALHKELYDRGYRGVSLRHVRALLSSDWRERHALVERLLVARGGDSAKLLLLLAHDEQAEVRAAALSALAASPRRELVRASWELALRDSDPRVGRLADSIGERLR